MNKILIRIMAALVILSPWIYLGETLRGLLLVILGVVILLATVDVNKKKKEEGVL